MRFDALARVVCYKEIELVTFHGIVTSKDMVDGGDSHSKVVSVSVCGGEIQHTEQRASNSNVRAGDV